MNVRRVHVAVHSASPSFYPLIQKVLTTPLLAFRGDLQDGEFYSSLGALMWRWSEVEVERGGGGARWGCNDTF